jgi:K+-transporting ATPase KdpF subunit
MLLVFAADAAAAPQAGGSTMLYLTAVVTVAALVYLGYAMIRPERF